MLLVLEDAHWIDPTTLELIERVPRARSSRGAGAGDDHLAARQPADAGRAPACDAAVAQPPGPRGVEAIVARAGRRGAAAGDVAAIVAQTDGVPLFVEELTKAVAARPARPTCRPRCTSSLMARLDRMPRSRKSRRSPPASGASSTRRCSPPSPGGPRRLAAGLDRLGAAELVFRRGFGTGARYVFKHALVHDAAYESLLEQPPAIHARLVTALEGEGQQHRPRSSPVTRSWQA